MLDQGPDQQKRTLRGAVGGARLPDIDQSNGNKAYKKIVPILRRSKKLIDVHDYPGAAKLAMRALDMDENCALSNHIMGICLDKLGHLSKALEFYERAWRLDPTDGEVYQNLALVAWKLDMLPAAEKFLQLFLEMQPGNVNGVINLGGVLRDMGRFDEAVELIRAAIYGHQDQSMLWNALATVLLESGQPEQGLTFYDEALRLEPNNARIWHNMAYAAGLAGDRARAAEAGEKALAMTTAPEDRSTIEYGLSQAYLALGQLEKGWHAHMARFDPMALPTC
jgi:tetratricopeptide (TPR) repeat protein